MKDFLALLRLADNPADEICWFRVLQLLGGRRPARTARRTLDVLVTDRDARGGARARALPAARTGPAACRRPRAAAARRDDRAGRGPSGCATRSRR